VTQAAEFNPDRFLKSLTHRPGVYRMLDEQGTVLYVGKARDLKRRVASYYGSKAHHPKTQALMNRAASVDVTVTETEREALLLEYNLIKEYKPRFNVLLRDDKSYPYIYVSSEQEFPRFEFHRGSRRAAGQFFGPFPSAAAVRQTLGQLQRLFQVRQCQDSFFANRTRPCLQHQIKRCTAPCVDLIDATAYRRDVANAINFLHGRNDAVVENLVARMEAAAAAQDYEQAARYRDQIAAVKDIQSRQVISGGRTRDADVLAVCAEGSVYCIAVIMIRGGRVLGSRSFVPRAVQGTEASEVLGAFLIQHYFKQQAPAEILVNAPVEDELLLEAALTERAGHRVAVRQRVRGARRRWIDMAEQNARQGVATRKAASSSLRAQLESLADLLDLDEVPARIECFDISHTAGGETVAACVVFGPDGPVKSDYRRFNIRGGPAGDDYAAIAEAVRRRYTRVRRGEAPVPDLILIDGGKGQLGRSITELQQLQFGEIPVVAVAKGEGRRPGREKLYLADPSRTVRTPPNSPALHLIQQVRDEAHRFAITGHRQRRAKTQQSSTLEAIRGLGPVRRRALLRHFGGLQGVRRAGIDDLLSVPGISRGLAERIFDHLHGAAPGE
jgi:excinuclease ABC subunit C